MTSPSPDHPSDGGPRRPRNARTLPKVVGIGVVLTDLNARFTVPARRDAVALTTAAIGQMVPAADAIIDAWLSPSGSPGLPTMILADELLKLAATHGAAQHARDGASPAAFPVLHVAPNPDAAAGPWDLVAQLVTAKVHGDGWRTARAFDTFLPPGGDPAHARGFLLSLTSVTAACVRLESRNSGRSVTELLSAAGAAAAGTASSR